MIFDITLNGVKVQKKIPTKWEEVKFKDFLQLQDNKEITAVSIFTGIDIETLRKANIKNLDALLACLTFLKKQPDLFNIPKSILGHEINQDLGFEAFGMYSDLKDELDKGLEGLELIKQYPLFCAIYCTKPYDFKVAESKVEEFNEAPCTEVLALGNFLLMRLVGLKINTERTSQKQLTALRRLRLALKGFRARLAFRVRFFILKRRLNIQRMKSSV